MKYRFHTKKGTRALAIILSLAMVITLLSPATYVKVKADSTGGAESSAAVSDVALQATASASGVYDNGNTAAIQASNLNNGHTPSSSGEPAGSWHDYGIDSADGNSWVQYDWSSRVVINSMSIYWMCDGEWGKRIPKSIKLEYKDASGNWQPIQTYDSTKMAGQVADQYNQFDFGKEVTTNCIRMTMERNSEDKFCSIHRWQVWGKMDVAQGRATASSNLDVDGYNAANLELASEPTASKEYTGLQSWCDYGSKDPQSWVQYDWDVDTTVDSMSLYWQFDGSEGKSTDEENFKARLPKSATIEYKDASGAWQAVTGAAITIADQKADQYNTINLGQTIKTKGLRIVMDKPDTGYCAISRWRVWGQIPPVPEEPTTEEVVTKAIPDGYQMKNKYFLVETGKYGQITKLQLQGDKFKTNYVMNTKNAPKQSLNVDAHEWMGELMFSTKLAGEAAYTEQNTSRSNQVRNVELKDNKVIVTYTGKNAPATDANYKGIKDFTVVETYSIDKDQLKWDINITNTSDKELTIGDLGLPLAFNEFWSGGDEIYETRTVDHSFVGKQSSYIYATRPSGQGNYLLLTPDSSTGAGFEYQDHWRTQERAADERAWCQDEEGWANGLNVFYVHSDNIKKTNRGYLGSTTLALAPNTSKQYSFKFQGVNDEADMKTALYKDGIIDAVALPGMTYARNMPGKLYLHTSVPQSDINLSVQCPHELKLSKGHANTQYTELPCEKTAENTYAKFVETKTINGEQYHIYDIKFADLGQNNVVVNYKGVGGNECQTVLQFYMMDDVATALETHSKFMVDKTQWNTPLKTGDKVFDDWMMDTKDKRGETDPTYWLKNYWGWGDDWGLTHGEYIAEKNVYQPVAKEIKAADDYLDIAIWNGLMREHQKDYKIHDFLMEAPNTSPTYRGYAYPHIYNTYFSMYKIASKYPDMIEYKESANTYLLRAYHILTALYGKGVSYNYGTGLMGELTTPDIIAALQKEGYYAEAQNVITIMTEKYKSFKNQKYPYGSEYSYDNTGEEAVYTLAKMNYVAGTDTENAKTLMQKIDLKTRACRGLQPVWYYYADPVTICGENWWNFQYSTSLIGYCMDDWLRLEDNGLTTDDQKATAARMNYAAKLANLTAINSGQIDSDAENIGAIAWTYQSEMGNLGAQGTGEGSLHNGWRQMAGEADLGLFGALQVLSSDVAIDPVFGLFGYGCDVSDNGSTYKVTPLDGLFTRLNFINQKLYVELDRDQYTDAEVAKDNTSIQLTMKNLEKTKHNTDVNITGLAPGTYQVSVGSSVTGSFNVASANTASTITIPLPAAETAAVSIVKGSALPNTAPVLTLAPTKTVELSDVTRLEAKATDDGYVNSTLTYKWEISSAPTGGNATIANADKPITNVTFDKAGEYVFKLTANDGGMSTSKDITVTVKENSVLPKDLVNYTFDKDTIVGTNKLYAKSDNKFDGAEVDNHTQFVPGKDGNGVKYTGKIAGGYIELPETITKNLDTATISMDVNLSETQSNRTTLFEFGKNVVVEFVNNTDYVNSNELEMTVNGKTASTGVELASGYWKNVELTVNGDDYTLYVNGVKKAELQDTSLKLSDIKTDAERYLIGRSSEEAEPFLKGVIDNFVVKSYVMSAAQLKSAYGISGTPSPVSAKACSVVTSAGNTPALPEKVSVLYSDGVYVKQAVTWDSISASKYAQDGSFTVSGKVTGTDVKASANVRVVSGTTENIAASAKASAIINTPDDLGGTDGLNDGFEPTGAEDTSHGVWHNWKGGNLQGAAWIQYNWDKEQVINGVDLYFFKNDAGNFDPESYIIEYQNAEGEWFPVSGANGLGVKINQYNATSFNPVATKAIRVTMLPAHDGIGVIEWKVYGYKAASDGSGSSSGSGGTDVNPPALAPQIQEAKTKESPADIQKGKASIKVDVDSQNLLDAAKKGKVNAELTVPDQQLVQQLADKSVKQVALDLVVPSAVLNNENISLSKIILPKSVLEGAKKAKKNLTVTVKDENNQIEASWTFTGKELAKSVTPLSDIDLAIIVGTEQDNDSIKKVVTKDKKNDKAVVIQFAHQETLPADAKVTVSLKGTHLQSGNGAYLYSYNSSTGKYKEVVGPKYKVDKSGNVTFEIGQGAQYVLLTARPDAAVTDRLVDGVVVPEAQKVPAGGTAKVKVTVPESAPAKITYKVDNRSLAKVDKNGKITAKGNGTVTLTTTVTIQGSAKTFVTKVTVKK